LPNNSLAGAAEAERLAHPLPQVVLTLYLCDEACLKSRRRVNFDVGCKNIEE
jgi:hypothetical protein